MKLPYEVKKQIRGLYYLLKVYGWRLNEDRERYKDVEGMKRKLDYVNWRLNALILRRAFTSPEHSKEITSLYSQKKDLEIALGLKEPRVLVPISYQIAKECRTQVEISLDEFSGLVIGKSKASTFQELEEKHANQKPNYISESFTIMNFTY